MTTEEKYRRILSNHLPPDKVVHDPQGATRILSSVDRVYHFLDLHKIHFHITRGRASKLGDYRRPYGEHNFHEMSINGDLNPYLFLWVFLHEAAHLETHLKYNGVAPHGHEWQEEYRQLIISHAALFPPEVQPLLARYVRRIPLNRSTLRQIEASLHRYDEGYSDEEHLTLDRYMALREQAANSHFRLKSKPDILFTPVERRRTRWLCRDTATGRQYTVAGSAEIIPESPSA